MRGSLCKRIVNYVLFTSSELVFLWMEWYLYVFGSKQNKRREEVEKIAKTKEDEDKA